MKILLTKTEKYVRANFSYNYEVISSERVKTSQNENRLFLAMEQELFWWLLNLKKTKHLWLQSAITVSFVSSSTQIIMKVVLHRPNGSPFRYAFSDIKTFFEINLPKRILFLISAICSWCCDVEATAPTAATTT